MVKKMLSLCMAFAIAILGLSSIPANAATNSKACEACLDPGQLQDAIGQLAKDGTITKLDVSATDKEAINKIVSTKDKQYATELKDLKKKGYKEQKQADNYITFENLKDNNVFYEKVGVVTEFYIKSNKEIARKQVWVNMKTNEVVRYDLMTLNEDNTAKQIVSFDKNTQQATNNGGISTYGFKFNGISFACSMAGLIACTAAFGGLAVFVPAVGAVAGLGCVIAFNIGCSFT